jgi:hypothetical protein
MEKSSFGVDPIRKSPKKTSYAAPALEKRLDILEHRADGAATVHTTLA